MKWFEAGKTLFVRFSSIWGNRFTSQFDDELAIKVWIEEWGVIVCSHGRPVVRKALDICKAEMDWPPVMAEFIRLCNRAAGLPSLEDAFRMAVKRDFSCPLVEKAFRKMDSWRFRMATEDESRRMFAEAWQDVNAGERSNQIGYSGNALVTLDG